MTFRVLAVMALACAILAETSPSALALTPRVAICGRVTTYDTVTPGGPFVTLGTQQWRSLVLGSAVPQIGQEICIWGIDVGNGAPPGADQRVGIVDYRIAPVASIGCADSVSGMAAGFQMSGETSKPLQN